MTPLKQSLLRSALLAAATLVIGTSSLAHPGHPPDDADVMPVRPNERVWTVPGLVRETGAFVMARDGFVQVRRADDSLVTMRIAALAAEDQAWIDRRVADIREHARAAEHAAPVELADNTPRQHDALAMLQEVRQAAEPLLDHLANLGVEVAAPATPPEIARSFDAFVALKSITTRWDDRYFYVESNGMSSHPMMVGITAWQQQVPIPQKYTGDNAWRIPLHPVPAKEPRSAKGNFLRGAIALAANGIPIFNPLNNRGDDAFLFGELDEFGGHCGRADDYHYHIAPVHLQKTVGKGLPIAYALDGYAVYGYDEPDGSPAKDLDAFNGHKGADGVYHYHATKKYPYLNGGFYGEVTERDGQVDPQPRASSPRPALPPLRGAKITDFTQTKPGSYHLTYDISGQKGTVSYTLADNGSLAFEFVDIDGKKTSETYTPRGNAAGRGGGRPGPGGAENPPRPQDRNPPPNNRRPRDGQQPPPRNDAPPAEKPAAAAPADSGPRVPALVLTSSSVDAAGRLSLDCTCDGKSESPAIEWKGAPAGTKSFAVSLWHVAPDQEKSYWLVYNIPATSTGLKQKSAGVGVLGTNGKRHQDYDPMCSKGAGVKTYHITVFALSEELKVPPERVTRPVLLEAVRNIKLAEATLDYQYERKAVK